jgi:hypothetical protein
VSVEVGREAPTARVAQRQEGGRESIVIWQVRPGYGDDCEPEARRHQDLGNHLETLRSGVALEAGQPRLADAKLLGELALTQSSAPPGHAQSAADLGGHGPGIKVQAEVIHA